jgi:hypothetical protein
MAAVTVARPRVYIDAHYPADDIASFLATPAAVILLAGLWKRYYPRVPEADDGPMKRIIGRLAAAIVITLIFGSVYVSLQQIGRRSADAAPAAAAAAQAQQMGSGSLAEPRLELTPDSGVFVIIYGEDNNPTSATVTLHGSLPVLPAGVLETARTSGTDDVTWQPEPGLRMAVVARRAADKVVVAGQSLTRVEVSDQMTRLFLAAGWLGSMVVLAAEYAITAFTRRRRDRS